MRTRAFVSLVATCLLASACSGGSDAGSPVQSSLPDTDLPAENVAWYYQQIDSQTDLSKLGAVQFVIVNSRSQAADTIGKIHGIGAKAYRYVQFYWAPEGKAYEGVDLNTHPDWAFCGPDGTPLVGRVTGEGARETPWVFLDANERQVHDAAAAQLAAIKAEGWDGVFFDRGWAATQTGTDATGADVWSTSSTCTDDPVEPDATFSDAYVSLLRAAKEAGLLIVLNTGISPYDPVVALRPDPRNAACRAHEWNECPTLDDVGSIVDWMADEAIAHPQDVDWERDFEANRRAEERGKVVGLITSGTLGGKEAQNRDNVYFEWTLVKLFAIPLAVNTGDDGCPDAPNAPVCNRFALFPELNSIRLGTPTGSAPESSDCDAGSTVRCIWTRAYERGLVVVNATPNERQAQIDSLGTDGCRYLFDVYDQAPVSGNQCVTSASLVLPPWSGRVLRAGETPW